MLRWTVAAAFVGLIGMGTAVAAQETPLRPYKPVTIGYDAKGADDPELNALVERLRIAARRNDVATIRKAASPTLSIFTPPIGFPPAAPPKPLKLDGEPDGPARLDMAFALRAPGGTSADRRALERVIAASVGEALGTGVIGRSAMVRDAFCAPAEPRFNRGQVLAIASAAGEVPDNLVILSEEITFLDKPDPAANGIATLKPGSVVPFVEGAIEGTDNKRDWYAIGLPNGKRGFAKGDRSLSFEAMRLCFSREGENDTWVISAVIVPSL